jgi:hypothetical protein
MRLALDRTLLIIGNCIGPTDDLAAALALHAAARLPVPIDSIFEGRDADAASSLRPASGRSRAPRQGRPALVLRGRPALAGPTDPGRRRRGAAAVREGQGPRRRGFVRDRVGRDGKVQRPAEIEARILPGLLRRTEPRPIRSGAGSASPRHRWGAAVPGRSWDAWRWRGVRAMWRCRWRGRTAVACRGRSPPGVGRSPAGGRFGVRACPAGRPHGGARLPLSSGADRGGGLRAHRQRRGPR